MESGNQYAGVAKDAYHLVISKGESFIDAWKAAAEKNIKSKESRKKGCPKATFIGLSESGMLRKIKATNESDSKNYLYAKFAISEWKKNNNISKKDMWAMIQTKFNKTGGQQCQLDVVLGLWDVII